MTHDDQLDVTARHFLGPDTLTEATKDKVAPTVIDAFKAGLPPLDLFCRNVEVGDFRTTRIPLPSGDVEAKVETFGAIVGLTRREIAGGDPADFLERLRAAGVAGTRRVELSLVETLFTGRGRHFSVANGNLLEGPASTLSAAALSQAVRALARRCAGLEVPTDHRPRVLLVPAALADEARTLVQTAVYPELTVVTYEPPDDMAGAWFLFAGAERAPVLSVTLRGRGFVGVQFIPGDDDSILRWRVFGDFNFVLGDPSAAVMAVGA